MPSELDRTRKLLFTLKLKYDIEPRLLARALGRGTIPTLAEASIIKKTTDSGLISDSIQNIQLAKSSIELEIDKRSGKLKNPDDLIMKGWIFQRLPKELTKFLKNEELVRRAI